MGAKEPTPHPTLPAGTQTLCSQCGGGITFDGLSWRHDGGARPRHMAAPIALSRPTSPCPPTGRQQLGVVPEIAIRLLAEHIAADLMTNPGGAADRLVLTSQDGRDMGGWARGPLTDRIEMLLRGER